MDYAQTLKQAQEKLRLLLDQRELIDREIEALTRIIEGAKIGAEDGSHWDPDNPSWVPTRAIEAEPTGVADAVRQVLRRSGRNSLLPTEIRDALETLGIEGSSSKNLLIHVHKTLKRMLENEEVVQEPRDGKMGYRLMTLVERMNVSMKFDPLGFLAAPAPAKLPAELPPPPSPIDPKTVYIPAGTPSKEQAESIAQLAKILSKRK